MGIPGVQIKNKYTRGHKYIHGYKYIHGHKYTHEQKYIQTHSNDYCVTQFNSCQH